MNKVIKTFHITMADSNFISVYMMMGIVILCIQKIMILTVFFLLYEIR